MSTALQKLPEMQIERQISIRNERRATFNEGMNPFLRQRPLIILPALNLNICKIPKTSLYQSENYKTSLKRSPPVQKKLVKSEETVSATKNVETTPGTEENVPKNAYIKAKFFSELHLVRRATPRRPFVVNEWELQPEWRKKLGERRSQVRSYFKDNIPSPMFSTTLQTVDSFPSPSVQVTRCDSVYLAEKQLEKAEENIPKQTGTILAPALKRVPNQDRGFSGTYQRANKNNDGPSVGASPKGLSLLKCQDFSIEVQNMTDHEIAEAMQSVQNAQLKDNKKITRRTAQLEPQWVASEPRAGPSGDSEIVAEPVVRFEDFRLC